jgi:four helix bundle protein
MYKYQSLEAWKQAHRALLLVLDATDQGLRDPRRWALFDQIRRAAISVEANVVEGYALGTTPQFLRHLRIARGSAAEAECLIRVCREKGHVAEAIAKEIEDALGFAMRAIHGLLRRPPPPAR